MYMILKELEKMRRQGSRKNEIDQQDIELNMIDAMNDLI